MIAGFNEWAASAQVGTVLPLKILHNHRLGIDAEDYIKNLLSNVPTREPLLPALGGLPFSLRETLEKHINLLKGYGVEPIFIFNGLSHNGQEDKMQAMVAAQKTINNAWRLYGDSQPDQAVNEFGTLCTLNVENICRYVQTIFRKKRVNYLVAPYSAAAQLVSMNGTEFCDAVAGSSDVLMFDIGKVITKIDYEREEMTVVTRKECMEALGANNSPTLFVDGCLLAGSSFLPTLPLLDSPVVGGSTPPRIKSAIDLLKQRNLSANALCMQLQQEDPTMIAMDYVDRYRKASSSIKQHVVLRPSGELAMLDTSNTPGDVHAFMGQRLPDELFAYISRGIIGPEVPQWRSSGEIVERPPLDGGESRSYQTLVRDRLTPLRSSTVALLSQSLNRWYGRSDITLRCWFDLAGEHRKLGITGGPDPRPEISAWNVRLEQIGERASKFEQELSSLAFAVKGLGDDGWAKTTVTPKVSGNPLDQGYEVRCNAIWRFLQLRGYINADHTLSQLGQSLATAFSKTGGDSELEEPIIVALELLRLNSLNAQEMFGYGGAPQRGSETDKRNALLVSRVACLANLRHKNIGFTGPLSRHLLAYRDMASAVRSNLRNLVEMSLCNMLVDGHVSREISLDDLAESSFDLPFLLDVDCALGVAVKSYLDELSAQSDPTSPEARVEIGQRQITEWFPHAKQFAEDLQKAFKLWDAVYAAVTVAPATAVSTRDKKMWDEVNTWLEQRR